MSTTVGSLVQTPHVNGVSPLYLSKITAPIAFDHQMIMRGFTYLRSQSKTPRHDFGVLYRVEPDESLIVQSNVMPDWSHCLPVHCIQTKTYSPKIIKGSKYYFRLAFNSISRLSNEEIKVESNIDPTLWLNKRQIGGKIQIIESFIVKEHGRSRNHLIPINKASVFGTITVTNPELLLHHIRNGIGRSRAYGCGLISLAPAIG
jgi:CRISPR system Cascade subunit CasE